jgi:hypothetical protein
MPDNLKRRTIFVRDNGIKQHPTDLTSIEDTAKKGHLDRFYWMMAGLSLLNMLGFVFCAMSYKSKKAQAQEGLVHSDAVNALVLVLSVIGHSSLHQYQFDLQIFTVGN